MNSFVRLLLPALSIALMLSPQCGAKENPLVKDSTPTFAKEIAPLVKNKCCTCHQSGGIAPFPLTSYNDLKQRLSTIDAVVSDGYMPPWKPVPNFGSFQNERSLTEHERNQLKAWIMHGALPGDPEKSTITPPPATGRDWQCGKPDLIVQMPEPFTVPAEGPDIYRCFVIPLPAKENNFVSHLEFHPGNTRVVHHALFFLDGSGEARKLDKQDPAAGYLSFGGPGFLPSGTLGGWAPGSNMQPLPKGVGRLVRRNSDLVVQLHFHPIGKSETVQSQIGIYYCQEPPTKLMLGLPVRTRKIDIAAGESEHIVKASTTAPVDFDVLQIIPHAHLLCRQIRCQATTPAGETVPLIWIKDWDFNWQEQYQYKQPIHLPAGSVINAEFIYDNSSNNFRNPNHPPKRVTWGEQTTDEMALIFLGGTLTHNSDFSKYVRTLITANMHDAAKINATPKMMLQLFKRLLNPTDGDEELERLTH